MTAKMVGQTKQRRKRRRGVNLSRNPLVPTRASAVAYLMDRYGQDVLPLALRLLAGETLPPRAVTRHVLITAANVFRVYPPFDMN